MKSNESTEHFLLFFLIVVFKCDITNSAASNDYAQFVDGDFAAFPKCCPLKASLIVNEEDNLNCTSADASPDHYQVFSEKIAVNEESFVDNCVRVECVDFVRNDTEWHLMRVRNCEPKTIYKKYHEFPKCCPVDYAYDPVEYRCTKSNDPFHAFNESLQVINISLAHCPPLNFAIVDFHEGFQVNADQSVNLTNGARLSKGRYCLDRNARTGKEILRGCVDYERACVHMGKRCLKKCCADGESYKFVKSRPKCVPEYEVSFNVSQNPRFLKSDKSYGIINAGEGMRYVSKKTHKFHIDEKGDFFIEEKPDAVERFAPKEAYYCIENFEGKQIEFLFLRPNSPRKLETFYLKGVILALSCACLLAMILCYSLLPEMQNVHGKSILMFCIFLFVAFLVLCIAQIRGPYILKPLCITQGFTIIFSFLGAFAWMNVICFDMWMAFGTMRVLNVNNKQKDRKKFLLYNLYAWGVPIIICGFALIAFTTKFLPSKFVPNLGTHKCYFIRDGESYDHLIYFIAPVSIMILINLVYFIRTSVYCYKVKNEIQKMRGAVGDDKEARKRKFADDKEKLLMLMKLFIVMGIPWVFESLSSIFEITHQSNVGLRIFELIVDCFNAAQGILIFCIFILKKKILESIKTRLGMVPMRRVSEFSTGLFRCRQGAYNVMSAKNESVVSVKSINLRIDQS